MDEMIAADSEQRSYEGFPGFEEVYLEDSWVLRVEESSESIKFEMELVLCEGHPQYHAPYKDEQYCYSKGSIVFDKPSDVTWLAKTMTRPAVDANGEVDFGNVDSFELKNGVYHLQGDWGEIELRSAAVTIEYQSERL